MRKFISKLFTLLLVFALFFSIIPKNHSTNPQLIAATTTKASVKKQIKKVQKEVATLKKKDKAVKKGSVSILGTVISYDPFVVKGFSFGPNTYYWATNASNASVYLSACTGYFKKTGGYKKFNGHTCVVGKFVTRKYEKKLKKKKQTLKKLKTALTNDVTIYYDVTKATVGETIELTAKKTKKESYNKISWTSSNKSIATVSKDGVVKGKKVGSVKITAKMSISGKKHTIKLTFVNAVKKITLNNNDLSLELGDTFQLKATLSPSNAEKSISWYSDNDKIVTVSNGLVKAKKIGTTTIIAETNNGLTAKCKVKVIDSSEAITISGSSINIERCTSQTLNENIYYNLGTDTVYYPSDYSILFPEEYKLFCFKDILDDEFDEKEYLNGTYDAELEYEGTSYEGPFGNIDKYAYIKLEYNITAKTKYKIDEIFWESSNEEVATVNDYGIIAILDTGTTTISATLPSEKTATCTLTVTAKDTVFDDTKYYSKNYGDNYNSNYNYYLDEADEY